MRDQPWTNGYEKNDVSLRRLELQGEKRVDLNRKTRLQRRRIAMMDRNQNEANTYDCALDLAPLALPPDLPPVILDGCENGLLWWWKRWW